MSPASIKTNRFFLPTLYGVLCLLVCVLAYYFYIQRIGDYYQALTIQGDHRVNAAKALVSTYLTNTGGDIHYLSASRHLKQLVNRANVDKSSLYEHWSNFMIARNAYSQIRWIDETGMERARVNITAEGKLAIVPDDQLQDKSSRYYFQRGIVLEPSHVYVSPLDMNVENSRIEESSRLTMRMVLPVFDNQKQRRGMLVLNSHPDLTP